MEESKRLENAPLHYAPTNELGVVFLFAHHAKKLGLVVDSVQAGFPDCMAFRNTQNGRKKIRIEFEYKSKNFKLHKHDPKKCDWIVCWEHDWADAPSNLHIVELRREYGLGFNVWISPVSGEYKEAMDNVDKDLWSVPSQSNKGDLILYYFTKPDMCIKHIFVSTEKANKVKAGWKPGYDYMANIRRIGELKSPIFLEDIRKNRALSTANFVRGQMQGRWNASEYWPYLYPLVIKRNPSLKKPLSKYAKYI
ncbi:MAG: hypothetical protein OEZ28_01760 [Nitrospinota bacterium]|nr:hypothetical protein [Nitrospinota bacterium]